jgi:adenosylhomocysteine nucleosidase
VIAAAHLISFNLSRRTLNHPGRPKESSFFRNLLVVSLGSAGSRRCELGGVYQIQSVSWRDMDASPIGIPPGVTPFADHSALIVLPTPLSGVPSASLSTGSDIVVGDRYAAIDADLVDMETFAVLRACQRFGVPMMGLRGVSDGPGELDGVSGWTGLLPLLDERLAAVVDLLILSETPE